MIQFLDLKRQYASIKQEIDSAINRVMESGCFVLGKELESFEKEFAQYCNARFAVGVASGTDAIALSLAAAGIRRGDEIITVSNTASATAAAIVAAGAKPVFVDIQEDSFLIDTALIEKNISKKTRAILPVHLFGQCCDMKPVMEIAEKHGIPIIEDACQAHGAEYNGKKSGAFGKAGCFSFYPTKNLGAFGDAGMVVSNDAAFAEKIIMLRNYGWKERYSSEIAGSNSRLDELQAAILRAKLPHLDAWNDKRRKIAKQYADELEKVVAPAEKPYGKHVYHLFAVKSKKRNALQEFLQKNNIGSLVHYPVTVHLQNAFKVNNALRLKVTERLSNEILSIPLYPELGESEIDEIIKKINSFG